MLVHRSEMSLVDHAGLTKLVVVLNIQTMHIICNRFRRSLGPASDGGGILRRGRVGLPVRSPQRRGVPTNCLREGPTSPLHLGTEIAPPVRDGAKSGCPYWPNRACLPTRVESKAASPLT